ncbi:telomerase RNA component interacting RNase-like [Palaemon carinicauda]|uniref:telomerase RNA component interacting RNase-like n=1 Tax=Palaemon carinicauda TaxID=392227 RepID=UPI0035B57386
MADRASPPSSSSSSYHPYPGSSSGSSDNDSNSNQEDSRQPANIFRNDGSFMEIFKKMQQRGQVGIKKEESDSKSSEEGSAAAAASPAKEAGDATSAKEQLPLTSTKKPIISLVGKRRGGRVLATGMVKKQRKQPVPEKLPEGGKTDAWSEYMNEVRKYREQSCEEEGKRRPLVK